MLAIRTRSGSGNDPEPSPDAAKQALGRMKRAGHNVDPFDAEHMRAYIMLRHQRGSVDGHSLVQFLNKTKANTNHNLGAQTELLYWGVPKTNFEGHPAAHWGKCLMTPDKLEGLELIGGQQVNWADHFVLDQEIPRLGLGPHVVIHLFSAGTNFAHPACRPCRRRLHGPCHRRP